MISWCASASSHQMLNAGACGSFQVGVILTKLLSFAISWAHHDVNSYSISRQNMRYGVCCTWLDRWVIKICSLTQQVSNDMSEGTAGLSLPPAEYSIKIVQQGMNSWKHYSTPRLKSCTHLAVYLVVSLACWTRFLTIDSCRRIVWVCCILMWIWLAILGSLTANLPSTHWVGDITSMDPGSKLTLHYAEPRRK